MFFPIRTDAPLQKTPWMNYALIVTNVLIFLLQQKYLVGPRVQNLLLDPGALHLTSFFTYQFLHAGVMHLVGNMLFLYIFGNNVNDRLGHVGYLAFYLSGGVIAGLGHVLVSTSPVLGASGSISAVTGAFLVLYPVSRVTVIYVFYLIGAIEVPSIVVIGLFFIMDVVLNFTGSSQVAHMAHAAGTIFGVTLMFVLLLTRLLQRDHFDLLGLISRWLRRRRFRAQVAQGYDFFGSPGRGQPPPPPKFDPEPVSAQSQRVMDLRAAIYEAMNEQRMDQAITLYAQLKAADPDQCLPQTRQYDLATWLGHEQRYAQASEAYETLLKVYPHVSDAAQVHYMLGLIYARHLQQYQRATEHLRIAAERLSGTSIGEQAQRELAQIDQLNPGQP